MMKMSAQYNFVSYLKLQFWPVFDKTDSSKYVIQFLLHLDIFQMKYDVGRITHLMWKIANIVEYSTQKTYVAKYSPFINLSFYSLLFIFLDNDVYFDDQELVMLKLRSILTSEITFD